MTRTLSRIPVGHGPIVVEAGWEMAGTTPSGQQLYIERTPRSRAVPDHEVLECVECSGDKCEKCDWTGGIQGKRIFVKNPMTGEPLYPKNKPEFYTHERMFYVASDGAYNQYKVDWSAPTPDQVAADKHTRDVADMLPALAGALVNAGLSPEEAAKRLTTPVPESEPYVAPTPTEAQPFDGSQESDGQLLTDPPISEEL